MLTFITPQGMKEGGREEEKRLFSKV